MKMRAIAAVAWWCGLLAVMAAAEAPAHAQEPAAIRVTSPLGRTGISGPVRIVAQVSGVPLAVVRFYVDGRLLGEDTDGPPYLCEWVDENPYEQREIRAEFSDAAGGVIADRVVLKPLEFVDETHVASVLVDASITDRAGRPIVTLQRADFSVFENEQQQTLDVVQLQRLPTMFTMMIDGSQSMSTRMVMVRAAARRIISRLRPGDMVTVMPFRLGIESSTGPTDDEPTITSAIAAINAGGGTAILDTLASLPERLRPADARQVIVLVTDGYDERSRIPLADALAGLKSLRATVFTVGIGGVAGISLKGESLLRQIAARTGGRALFPSREEQLPDVYETIVADVHSRYLLTYTPSNQEPDGRFRKLRVAVPDPSFIVRARDGYVAPSPPPIRPTIEFSAYGDARASLTLDDLELFEDGVRQPIDAFQEAVAPISIALAIDGSGSVRPVLDALKGAARTFVDALRPADPLALVRFADTVTLAHGLSTTRRSSLESIDAHLASGGTALWDGLHDAMTLLDREAGRKAIVVVTDGRDEDASGRGPGSRRTLDDLLLRITETDVPIYAIGLGNGIDRAALQRIADASGGASYFPADVRALADEYRRVIDDLRRRYVVTYTSTNRARDGAWRSVLINATKAGVIVRSRPGYHAPGVSRGAGQEE